MGVRIWSWVLYGVNYTEKYTAAYFIDRPAGEWDGPIHFQFTSRVGWSHLASLCSYLSQSSVSWSPGAAAATTQIQNQLTGLIERSVVEDLAQRQLGYGDLVTIQREESGAITSLSTDMASMNQLRAYLVNQILEELDGIDVSTIQIPIGSLFDSELLWAAGPSLHVRAMSVGTVQAEFESEFSEAGVNQTRHRIWLHLSIPATVLLAGSAIEVPLDTELCVAETVIVGQVPNTYLSLDGISGH